jgi:curved DNA-binding protein CbpA
MSNPYETLGIDPTADSADIKSAYRRKAKSNHPDKGGDPEKFAEVNQAWMILRDPDRRAKYDATGETDAPIDDTLSQIGRMLCALFAAELDRVDIDFTNIVARVDNALGEMRKRTLTQAKELEKPIVKAEKAMKRLKYNGERGDMISTMLMGVIETQREAQRKLEKEREQIDAAREYLKDYTYETEKGDRAGDLPPWKSFMAPAPGRY